MGRACSLSLVVLIGCCALSGTPLASEAAVRWSLLAWVCADGDLGPAGTRYAARLERAVAAQGWTLALAADRGRLGGVRTAVSADGRVRREPSVLPNIGSAAALAEFLEWGGEQAAGDRRVLAIYGHGPGAGDANLLAGDALVIDDSERDPLTATEVAEAVAESGLDLDIVVLDCCYGGRAQTLWSLRGAVDLAVAWGGRAPSGGLPWEALCAGLQAARDRGGLTAAMLAAPGAAGPEGGPIAVDAHGLAGVSAALSGLVRAILSRGTEGIAAIATARALCSDRGPGRELCDLRELCARLAAEGGGDVAIAADRTIAALDNAMFDPRGTDATESAGLLVWMPGGIMGEPPPELETDAFAIACGWSDLIGRCFLRQQELLRRTWDAPQRGRSAA